MEKVVLQTILKALVVNRRPAHFLLLFIFRHIAQWFIARDPANNNLLFFRRQIEECLSVRAQTPDETHEVQFSFYIIRGLFDYVMEL